MDVVLWLLGVLLPCMLLILLALLIFLCCSRKYRLNWWERNLIHQHRAATRGEEESDAEKQFINHMHTPQIPDITIGNHGSIGTTPRQTITAPGNVVSIVTTKRYVTHGLKSSSDSDSSSSSSVVSCSGHGGSSFSPMGSRGSSPVKDRGTGGVHAPMGTLEHFYVSRTAGTILEEDGADENAERDSGGSASTMGLLFDRSSCRRYSQQISESLMGSISPHSRIQQQRRYSMQPESTSSSTSDFWVPPAMVEKKRAQSLIPSLGLLQQSQEGSPSHTPTSSSSLQEMVFTYQGTPGGGGGGGGGNGGGSDKSPECQPPASRRRRASMQDALDHTKINARLYEQITTFQQQQSINSIQEENLGSANLCLTYSPDQALLTVRLIQVRDLCPREINSLLNPYARMTLKPHTKEYLQSKVHKHTLHPEFEEEFIFELTPSRLGGAVLDLHVLNSDSTGHDDILGQVLLPLDNINLSEPVVLWKGLSHYDKKQEEEELGEVMFSIGYLSSAGRLTVSVSKARNLRPLEDTKNTSANPFVKVSILSNGKRLKKKKTSTKRGSLNPVWNEALVYNLGKEDIQNISLEFEVINDNLLGSSEVMGRVLIGKSSRGDELTHWCDVLHSKNALARWHRLKKEETSS